MKHLLLIAVSALALTACGTIDDIAKKHDAQHALLLTSDGGLVVVNVATGKIVNPDEGPKAPAADNLNEQNQSTDAAKHISDEEFAEIKRKFESTFSIQVIRGSVCKVVVKQPPGHQYTICSPPAPKWW